MRICVISDEYSGVSRYSGGIGTHLAFLCPALVRLGHEVDVFSIADEARTFTHSDVNFHMFKPVALRKAGILNESVNALRYARAVLREKYDVILAAEWGGNAAFVSTFNRSPLTTLLATSLQQIREIAGVGPESSRRRREVQLQLFRERFQAEHSAGIIASSNSILSYARANWSIEGKPAAVIPNFVDATHLRELAKAPSQYVENIRMRGPVVLYFGRLETRKGVSTLADSMRHVWREEPETQFVFIGADQNHEGALMSEYVRNAAGPHGDRVHILGSMNASELMPEIAAADIVTMPSYWENFALAALEARALGKPMVVSNSGGFTDFFEHDVDGVMVEPRDPLALADAYVRLLQDDVLRKNLGEEAWGRAERYTPEAVAPAFVTYFEQIAGK